VVEVIGEVRPHGSSRCPTPTCASARRTFATSAGAFSRRWPRTTDSAVLEIPEDQSSSPRSCCRRRTARFELSRVRALVDGSWRQILAHVDPGSFGAEIPRCPASEKFPFKIETGDQLIVDGVSRRGSTSTRDESRCAASTNGSRAELSGYRAGLQKGLDLPSVTLDGTSGAAARECQQGFRTPRRPACIEADGIGLYRTEVRILYPQHVSHRGGAVSARKRAAQRIHPRKIVLRLLDVGGDKQLPYFPLPQARNPSLAQRGIRLLLKNPGVLRSQLRALLRVSAEAPVVSADTRRGGIGRGAGNTRRTKPGDGRAQRRRQGFRSENPAGGP